MTAVIDMRDFGSVNDPAATGNTAALVAALSARGNNEPSKIFFASGDWYFSGVLPVGTGDLKIWDNVSISGEFSAPTVQHQEEGTTSTGLRRRTRFIIDLTSETDIWWNHIRTPSTVATAYRFGPVAFRDISFQFPDGVSGHGLGSLFAFGDPAITTLTPTMRGLCFERCYFSRKWHYQGSNIGDGRAWLIAAGGTPDRGIVLNRNSNSFGLRMHQVYDANIDVCVRGWKYGVIDSHSDCIRGSIRGISCGKFLDSYPIDGVSAAPVGAQWSRLFGEAPALCGFLVNGQVAELRAESSTSGYPSAQVEESRRTTPIRRSSRSTTWAIQTSSREPSKRERSPAARRQRCSRRPER